MVSSEYERVGRGISKVICYSGVLVDILAENVIGRYAATAMNMTYTRPCVGSGIAWKVNAL
jgi:hypothetical protein